MLKRVTLSILIALIVFSPISADAIKYKGDLEANESLTLPEQSATPANPSSGKHKLYFKDDGTPYSLDSSGNENPIGVSSSVSKNYIINGRFRLWQRGTSFTNNGYGADRWKHGSENGHTVTRQAFTLGQTDVPGEPEFYWRNNTNDAGSATETVLAQRIEDVRTLAGQTATLSFWAKAGTTKTFQIVVQQVFGTGGTPSADVTALSQSQSIGTTWAKYTYTVAIPSITGKTLGTNDDDYLEVAIQETASFSVFILDVAQVQLEKGNTASEFEYRPLSEELRLAQRYYCKTYNQNTAPGTATSVGALYFGMVDTTSAVRTTRGTWSYPVTMRKAPTITFYNYAGTSGVWQNASSPLALDAGDSNVQLEGASGLSTDARIGGHVVADAEL